MQEAKKEITGRLCLYYETGMEGVGWMISNGTSSEFVETGNLLTVYKDDTRSEKEWEGIVDLDKSIGSVSFMAVAQHGVVLREHVKGYGFQRDMPLHWAAMFIRRLPAVLVPSPQSLQPPQPRLPQPA